MPDMILDHQPQTLCEYFSQWEEFDDTIFYDEFDAAFVGFGWQFHTGPIVIYDQGKVMEIMVAARGYDGDEPMVDVLDAFESRVQGAYVGEHTPIFLTHVGEKAVQDFLKRKAGAEISGWSVEIATEGVTEIS